MGTSLGTLSYLAVSKQNAISMGAPETLGIFGSNSHSFSEPCSVQRRTSQPDFYLLPTGPAKCWMRFLGPSRRPPEGRAGARGGGVGRASAPRSDFPSFAHRNPLPAPPSGCFCVEAVGPAPCGPRTSSSPSSHFPFQRLCSFFISLYFFFSFFTMVNYT